PSCRVGVTLSRLLGQYITLRWVETRRTITSVFDYCFFGQSIQIDAVCFQIELQINQMSIQRALTFYPANRHQIVQIVEDVPSNFLLVSQSHHDLLLSGYARTC